MVGGAPKFCGKYARIFTGANKRGLVFLIGPRQAFLILMVESR